MTILTVSSSARDRKLSDWYQRIESGQLRLPRFQRFEAWDRSRVCGFLNTVIQNLPVGVTLLLEVGDEEKFKSRTIETASASNSRVNEHLLDGQQRLTAFWRAMWNNYPGETYFVYLPQFDQKDDDVHDADDIRVEFQGRWEHNGKPRPVWADVPKSCLERGLMPINLLRPGDLSKEIEAWISAATDHLRPDKAADDALEQMERLAAIRTELRQTLTGLRERVAHFNLPFLALPASTDADMALRVFVNMNTNSKPLTMFDLTVAKVEEEAGASLHELQEALEAKHPQVTRYGDISYVLLQVAALLQEQVPNQSGIHRLDKRQLVSDWSRISKCMVRTADFLARQHVHDEARLPTKVVLPVIAACYDRVAENGDAMGHAERLLRAYFWSASFTNRYEGAANTRAFQDYKALAGLIGKPDICPADWKAVPVLDRTTYSLPSPEELMRVGWPKGSDRMARAILATTLYFGGWDFADGTPASYTTLEKREYHHVFPDALLAEAKIDSYLALNCALITWKTNRNIGRKDPMEYLNDRVEWSDQQAVDQRLRTHLLDYKLLGEARYKDETGIPLSGTALSDKLGTDFATFLSWRAQRVALAATKLAEGSLPSIEVLMAEAGQAG
ncbi:hypothetical protein D3C71_1134380 [compost metagenome]